MDWAPFWENCGLLDNGSRADGFQHDFREYPSASTHD
jgi:hypothetical protein